MVIFHTGNGNHKFKVIYQVILNSKGQSECDPYLSDAHCLKLVLIPPLFLSF